MGRGGEKPVHGFPRRQLAGLRGLVGWLRGCVVLTSGQAGQTDAVAYLSSPAGFILLAGFERHGIHASHIESSVARSRRFWNPRRRKGLWLRHRESLVHPERLD